MKFVTRNLHSFPPHLDYVATLLSEVKSLNWLKLQKIQPKNRTVYVIKMKHYMSYMAKGY